jgi:hypothetical protein
MKLSDTFIHRIVVDQSKDATDCVDACMHFLETLVLDPADEERKSDLKRLLKNLENYTPPTRTAGKKKTFFYTEIVPLLRDIAPDGCYFGRHPNDENIYGFWERSLLLDQQCNGFD